MTNREIQKNEIQRRLNFACKRMPLPRDIDFCIVNDTLYLTVNSQGTMVNMQHDGSAFEGWSICMKAAFPEVNNVVLSWEPPHIKEVSNQQEQHYNRFVMRVASFLANYSWLSIDDKLCKEVEYVRSLLENKRLRVNYPKKQSKEKVDKEKKPEAHLEREIVERLREHVSLTDHQLPVGLFVDEVAFTPGRASQIDIWQVEDTTLRVFELKVSSNKKVGILSELMFYANTMYYLKEGLISYPDDVAKAKDFRHFKALHQLIESGRIDKIDAVFMVQKLHPLLDAYRNEILKILSNNKFSIQYYIREIP